MKGLICPALKVMEGLNGPELGRVREFMCFASGGRVEGLNFPASGGEELNCPASGEVEGLKFSASSEVEGLNRLAGVEGLNCPGLGGVESNCLRSEVVGSSCLVP